MNSSYGFSSVNDYLSKVSGARQAKNTEYAKERGGYTNENNEYSSNNYWLLRSPGVEPSFVARVDDIGYISGDITNVSNPIIAVRPALHLNLSSNKWSKAGTVSSDGKESVIPYKPTTTVTPTQTSKPKSIAKPAKVSAPDKVTKLTAKNKKKKSVTLSWKKASGAKGYQLQYALNKKFTKKKKSKLTKKRKFTVKKLKKKKTYYFRVRAYKLNGKKKVYGKWSGVKKVKIKK